MPNLKKLPVICSIGGINSAGITSSNLAYQRLVYETLSKSEKDNVLKNLNALSGLERTEDQILNGTLVRQINKVSYDPDGLMTEVMGVNAAAQLPDFFDLSKLYNSRQHPKGIQMTIFGVSDAIANMGIDWETKIKPLLDPNRIAVYAGPAIGQLDKEGMGGLMQSRLRDSRSSSKHLSMSLIEMSADFINAYILGSVGKTGLVAGACATYQYNLHAALSLIKNDEIDFAVVGSSEAPINAEVTDGFMATKAIADDKKIIAMQERLGEFSESANLNHACRPFGDNCGMILGESAQFSIVTTLEFALEIGADILCAVPEVHINADGIKKSISSPGIGNYITMAQSVAKAKKDFNNLQESLVIAHGTGTLQNRSTESDVFSKVASSLNLNNLHVTGIKGYIGHSMGPAGGDELLTAIGIWNKGIIPGLKTTPALADDVNTESLNFCLDHTEIDPKNLDVVFLNAKGFGGNNATCPVYSPSYVQNMIKETFSDKEITAYEKKKENTILNKEKYYNDTAQGNYDLIYRFNESVLDPKTDLEITDSSIKLKGYKKIDI
ncbi:beta-ketoacyl synthase [SAR86 cluster bacterium]|nr:beta-ketoacyl synthase [SAR86 cluster bacterium]